MRIRDGYSIVKIAQADYILPYGQNINDNRHGIRLNETSLFLIRTLQKDKTYEELLAAFASYFEATTADYPLLKKDLNLFLKQLWDLDLLCEEPPAADCRHYFQIGTLTIGLDTPSHLIPDSFLDFICTPKPSAADLSFYVTDRYPKRRRIGRLLLRTLELMIFEDKDGWFFLYPPGAELMECHLSKDASRAWFYCKSLNAKNLQKELFFAFRLVYLALAQKRGLFALHSASILYEEKAWLFSGSSGTGKSTHTGLWNREFHTPLLNGDLNLIGIEHGKALVYGLPWCGTSDCYTPNTYPLGGITLLKQHPFEKAEHLTIDQKQLAVMQRLVSPTWTEDMLHKNLAFTASLCEQIPVFSLLCTKEPSAAHFMKHLIDDTANKGLQL